MTSDDTASPGESPIDWMPLSPRATRVLTRQLRREIPRRGHVLSGEPFVIIAKNADHDDVLLSLPGQDKWAVCHMTWSKRRESPPWPATRVVGSLGDAMQGV